METLGKKIWKGSMLMAMDADHMAGGVAVLWNLNSIGISNLRGNHLSLMANFNFLEMRAKGTLVNIYGQSTFP